MSSTCASPADIIAAQTATSAGTVNGTAGGYRYVQMVFASYSGTGSVKVFVAGDKSAAALGSAVTVTSGNITVSDGAGALNVICDSGCAGGTQYTEDAAAAADPIGGALNLVRADTPGAVTNANGDNVSARGTNFGAMYVTHIDQNGALFTADGAAVAGVPLRISGKDGSGNTQDIITDTTGNQTVVGTGTAGAAAGGVLTVQGVASMTPILATVSQSTASNLNATVDSELPPAAALADATANPTVPAVGAFMMAWTGSNWNRVQASVDGCSGTTRSRVRIKSDNTNNDDETQIKASSGTLCSITGSNANTTTGVYVKCTNLTAASTTPGSSAIYYSVLIPASQEGGAVDLNLAFDTALTCYLATGKADSDATDPAQDDAEVYVIYN